MRLGGVLLCISLLIVLAEAAPHQVHHLAPAGGDETGCALAAVIQGHQAALPSLGPPLVAPDVSWSRSNHPADSAGACLPRPHPARAPPD